MSVNGFDYVLFPLSISDFLGTVQHLTIVTPFLNGAEQRISRWNDGKMKFDAALGVRSLKDLRTLVDFSDRRKGKARGFMVRSLLNFQVTGATNGEGEFGVGDGTNQDFQLKRTTTDYIEDDSIYGTTGNTATKNIYLPEHGTVKIYIDGNLKTEGVHYTLDYKSGNVHFIAAPALGAILEWIGQYFIPVRFVEDEIPTDQFLTAMKWNGTEMVIDKAAGQIPNVAMIEIRDLAELAAA